VKTKKQTGSAPVIPHSRPTLGPEETRRVAAVLASGHIAQGEEVRMFERAAADKFAAADAVAVGSGTAALHLTLMAMGIGPGHQVVIPSYVCTALLNAVRYVGAEPVLADIDARSGNIDPADARKRLTRRTRAVIVPHLFGCPADLRQLLTIGVPVIEDCAQAIGARYRGRPVGSFGQAAVFSFYATKVITTGEGGMVLSGSRRLLARIRDLRQYDRRTDDRLRFNYKMTDIQAAVGISQLARLDDFIATRRRIAQRYFRAFEPMGLSLPPRDPGHIYYRFVVDAGRSAAPLIRSLQQQGIFCEAPVHRPLHRRLKRRGYPAAERAARRWLSIPIYPLLTPAETDRIVAAIARTYETS
jgi:perosamine synthetase